MIIFASPKSIIHTLLDLSNIRSANAGTSNSVRGISAGGRLDPSVINVIEFININSGGNMVDFGDRTVSVRYCSGCSNAHGGLNDGFQGTKGADTT